MITLIFGAGASYGSGACTPHNPPLGNDLFKKLDKIGGAYHRLDRRLKQTFIDKGFEAGMKSIAEKNDNRDINPLQKELAGYLSTFKPAHGNAYIELFNHIKPYADKLCIATLNYDLLIENSLAHHRINFDYTKREHCIPLLKVHGSCHFLPDLGSISMSNNVMVGCETFVEGLPIHAVFDPIHIGFWCMNPKNSDISPVMCMYEGNKSIKINKPVIDKIQQEYQYTLSQSSQIIIVGMAYIKHDKHVWDPIRESKANILVIDPYPDRIHAWKQEHDLKHVDIIASEFGNHIGTISDAVEHAALST